MHKERRRCFIDFCLQTGETRVWRTYVGGARLNEWHGRKAEQGFFPEDWAASTTRAVNAGREDLVEGLSRVVSMPDQPYLLDLIQKDPEAFFGMVIYKELNWETLMKTLKDSVKDITVITINSGDRPLRLAVLRGGAAGGCLHGVLPGCRALAAESGLRRIKKHQKRAGLSCVFKRGFVRLL